MELLTQTYKEKISNILSCYDRIIITGILPEISYAQGMTSYLYKNEVMIFKYAEFAEPFREVIRENAERIATENNIAIEFIRNHNVRKEEIVTKKLNERGTKSGIVHILSAMEACPSYIPWHNKGTGKTYVKPNQSKCLHYYFYFMDELLGLGYVRVPTWCPFRLQIYFNGHQLLANQLNEAGIDYTLVDNAFDSISNLDKAQQLADDFPVKKIHRKLEEFAWKFCPVYKKLKLRYQWNIMQAEYATDIVFKKQQDLQRIYSELIATAIHTVKPENIATFLGRKLDERYEGEMGNNYHVRLEGTRIKHHMGEASIKMYDKFSKILRIETTINNVSFFKHYREVVHRDGTMSMEMAPFKKTIYSLPFLKDNMKAANNRYLEFISAFDNKEVGHKRLQKITEAVEVNKRTYRGFNFFSKNDLVILQVIIRGEFNISGFRNKHLRKFLDFNSNKISRILKRLWSHGLIKKVRDCHKYYLTKLGKETIIMAEKIKELIIVPSFCY